MKYIISYTVLLIFFSDMYVTSESTMTKIEGLLRYPGDINISHLDTSGKVITALNIAKKTILHQRRKIKTLQQTSNRYKQKICSLKNLVEQLRKNSSISETTAKILLVLSCVLFFTL